MQTINILEEVKQAWGWVGIDPVELVTENEFGNLIIKDAKDQFWRLCPEDVYCEIVANSIAAYNELIQDEEFLDDWFMTTMVEEAKKSLGELKPDRKYHLVIPGVLGGEYTGKNIKTVPFIELIRFSGDLGKQIKDLPDGSEIELKTTP
jgi:hypothetical protein